MLKIKDNVDLRELTMFGFVFEKKDEYWYKADYAGGIYIKDSTKKNEMGGRFISDYILGSLYEIIEFGIVEKVEDK